MTTETRTPDESVRTSSGVETIALPGKMLRVDRALLTQLSSTQTVWQYLDPQTPDLAATAVTVGGRAAAWYVHAGSFEAVLRFYRRGGWISKISKDTYFWLGLNQTRAFSEFALMRALWQAGLAVPRPLAAVVYKQGLTYRAALLTERIADAQPLAHATDVLVWGRAGIAIAAMHRLDVWHADLNAFNVLWDAEGKVWLIDFDRARRGSLNEAKRADNLARLLRSLKKTPAFYDAACWTALCASYEQAWLSTEPLK